MGILVLVLLVAAWGLVLGPALLKNAHDPSPWRTEKMYKRAMRALGNRRSRPETLGARRVLVPPKADYPSVPASSSTGSARAKGSAAERRRRNLTALAGFIVVTFFLGLIPALRSLLYVNLVADVLLIAYLGAAIYYAARPPARPVPRPSYERALQAKEAAGGSW